MADLQTPVTPPTQVAANIAKGIQEKANGKTPVSENTAIDPKAVPAADPNAGKEKYVVEGKEIWLTPEQARSYTSKGIAFEPKVTQLGHLQHEVNQFMQTLSQDPLKILTDKRIGLTPDAVLDKLLSSGMITDQFAERIGKWYWENVALPSKMTPEQRRAMELEKENKSFKDREAAAKDMMIKEENKRKAELALNTIKAQISEAMKESGLPSNETPLGAEMARMVADVMRVAYFQRQTVTPKQAIELVRTRIKSVQNAFYDSLDEESLVKELGEKNAEKVKKYFLKLVKEAEKPKNNIPSTRNGDRRTISRDEFFDQLAELKKKN